MATANVKGEGTPEEPWVLKTPPGKSEYQMYRNESSDPPALVCIVGKTQLSYQLRCLEDLHGNAQSAWRLDAAWKRGRTKAGQGRDG